MNCMESTSQCLKLFKSIQHSNSMVNIMFGPSGVSIITGKAKPKIKNTRVAKLLVLLASHLCDRYSK